MSSLLRDLERQVDVDHVLSRAADRAAYAYDASGASGERHLPDAVVFPASTAEVAGVVQVCAHHGVPIVPRGAGTGYAGGAVALHGGVVVNTVRMSSVLGLERDAMRVHAEAGVVTDAVHRGVVPLGLYYPPDPASASTSTLGGNVVCNAGGAHARRYGVTADYLVGATAVLADGSVHRVGESGDGDAALLRLLPASEGTLAIVTEVLLRLISSPAARVTFAATFADMGSAAAAVSGIGRARVVPAALEFLDKAALRAVANAGADPMDADAGALVLAEVEGDAGTTDEEARAVEGALQAAGATRIHRATGRAEAARLWAIRKAVSAAVATVRVGNVTEDIVVPLERVAETVALVHALGERHRLPAVVFGHLGDGHLQATFLLDPRVGERPRADAAAAELLAAVLDAGGSATGEHGVGYAKLPWVERQLGPGAVELMRGVQQALDPQGLLNPGKKIPAFDAAPSSAQPANAEVPVAR
ncbi:MAG: FAD-binding oxidoreductase [Candidatus Dormibacteria bacterium]